MGPLRYRQLDPVRDHETIVKWMLIDTWKFDLVRGTLLALLKSLAFPEIAKILCKLWEPAGRNAKDSESTDLLLSQFIESGYSSPLGERAIQSLSSTCATHSIANHRLLYVLSSFVAEPIRWIESYGWRPLLALEKNALFYFWIEVGRRISIKDLFANLETMLDYHDAYEAKHMIYRAESASLYREAVPHIAKALPFSMGPFREWTLPALMSPQLCMAFNVKPKGLAWRSFMQSLLKLRGFGSQLLPSRPRSQASPRRSPDTDASQENYEFPTS